MKTYFLDTIDRLKRFDGNLNFKAFICNKAWIVFNDNNVKTSYLFQEDGTLFITNDGLGIKNTWKYVSATNSLLIDSQNEIMMLHPTFVDNILLVLKLDGANKMAFLIDEKQKGNFEPKSLENIKDYFYSKYKRLIDSVMSAEEKAAEEEAKRIAEEAKKEEIRKKEAELDLIPVAERKKRASEIKAKIHGNHTASKYFLIVLSICIAVVIFILGITPNDWDAWFWGLLILVLVFLAILLTRYLNIEGEKIDFRNNNPYDPGTKYL